MIGYNRNRRDRKKTGISPFLRQKKDESRRVGLSFRKSRKRIDFSYIRPMLVLSVQLAFVIILAYGVVSMFGIRLSIAGESMEPTLADGDEVLTDRISYRFSEPARGDLIVFYPGGSRAVNPTVKRIIALPGDTVRIENGAVYVDGSLIEDVARTDYISEPGLAANDIILAPGEYFVLGDNRNNSEDSRYATIGNVTRDMMVGKVWLRVTSGNFGLIQ